MLNIFAIIIGKVISTLSATFNLGSGSTWPGHIALSSNPNFIRELIIKNSKLQTVLIAGTNGKTTTGKLIQTILEQNEKSVFQNAAGANLTNGIASSLIYNSDLSGNIKKDIAVFEIDENTLPLVLKEIPNPNYIILLNLFRDQLDRYGEVNTIASKWKKALEKISNTTLILNAEDPLIAHLASHLKGVNVKYFGAKTVSDRKFNQHASDSTYCPECGNKLIYKSIFFSHLGNWSCEKCGLSSPQDRFTNSTYFPLTGIYNEYNTNAAVLLTKCLGISDEKITKALKHFQPAFGRQEIINYKGKNIQIFLSKNPTGFNESLRTIVANKAKNVLIVLNDRIPDGRDVSWIWDVDFENFSSLFKNVTVSGDRTFDMGLRLKYAEFGNFQTEENLSSAINQAISKTSKDEILYILPTYSAMLEVRKILTGKKIL